MKAAPTASGLPISVCPLPSGSTITLADLARRAGHTDSRRLLDEIDEPGAPVLPTSFLMGGAKHYAADFAAEFLQQLAAFRLTEPERKAAAQAKAKRDHEARIAARNAEDERQAQWGREQALMREENARIKEARMEAAKVPKQAIILDANGRRVL